jgi:hypothetical protein
MKFTRIGEESFNCSCFEIDQEMDAILLIIDIGYGDCRIVIKSVQQCTYFLFFYHRLVISLQANTLTSLFPYATDLTSDR